MNSTSVRRIASTSSSTRPSPKIALSAVFCTVYQSFQYATGVQSLWRLKIPLTSSLKQLVLNLLLIPAMNCLFDFVLSTNKVCFIIGVDRLHHQSYYAWVACRAATKNFHLSLSFARCCSSSIDFPSYFASFKIVLLHVSLGLPRRLFPLSGDHIVEALVMSFRCFLETCPNHFHLRLLIFVSIIACLVLSSSF